MSQEEKPWYKTLLAYVLPSSGPTAASSSSSSIAVTRPLPKTFVKGFHDEEAVKRMKYRILGQTGMEVSILSLGASSLGGVFRDTDDDEAVDVVLRALKHGVNLIDTAPWYGHTKSERILGRALKGVPREAYYINTKVGRYSPLEDEMFDFRAERVIQSVYESLERLQVSYIDCVQVHDPEFAPSLDIILNGTLPALQQLKEEGIVKHIGITGYPLSILERLLKESPVRIDTCLSYCHYTLNDTTLERILPFLEEKGCGLINASPMAMGLLSHRGPPAWHPAHEEQKLVCREAAKYCANQGVEISKLALHFTLSKQKITTTLVSTASVEEMMQNIEAVYECLSAKEKKVLDFMRQHYFKALKGKESWEGVEVSRYWETIGKNYILATTYGRGVYADERERKRPKRRIR